MRELDDDRQLAERAEPRGHGCELVHILGPQHDMRGAPEPTAVERCELGSRAGTLIDRGDACLHARFGHPAHDAGDGEQGDKK